MHNSKRIPSRVSLQLALALAGALLATAASAAPNSANNKYSRCQAEYDQCKALGRNDCRTKYMACIKKDRVESETTTIAPRSSSGRLQRLQ
ncbi:MAG: hypothetical protein R3E87_23635 [Burkholderiaceae bacterium]